MNETQIRELLVTHLSKKHDASTIFIKELFINNFSCRADLVMANGQLSVFEIKSKLDTLDRLPDQVRNYNIAFENVIIVCADKHVEKVMICCDQHIGVWSINDKGEIKLRRRSSRIKLTKDNWLRHLPIDELKTLLKSYKMPVSGRRDLLTQRLNESLSQDEIRDYVLAYFKSRDRKILALKRKKEATSNRRGFPQCSDSILSHNTHDLTQPLMVMPRKTAKNPNPRPIRVRVSQVA